MKVKERVRWAAVAGVLLGIIIGLCISPLTANEDTFGVINCTKLRILGEDGDARVVLYSDKHGNGRVSVSGNDPKSYVFMGVRESGALFSIANKGKPTAVLISDDVSVVDRERGWTYARMAGDDKDGGYISVADKNARTRASMSVRENGGNVTVYGTNTEGAAGIGINPLDAPEVYVSDNEARVRMTTVGDARDISVKGKTGKTRIGVYDRGGYVSVEDNGAESEAVMSIDEHGGYVRVQGKNGRAMMDSED